MRYRAKKSLPPQKSRPNRDKRNYSLFKELAFVLIVSLLTCLLAKKGSFLGLVPWALSTLPHELGHAIPSWWMGIVALPTFTITLQLSAKKQLWVFAVQLFLCYQVFKVGRYFSSKLITALPFLWVLAAVICSLFLTDSVQEQFIIWSGNAGQQAFGTAMIALGFAFGPNLAWVRKQFYALYVWGGIILSSAAWNWRQSKADPSLVPFGGYGETSGDSEMSNGDIDRLINDFNWTMDEVISSYNSFSIWCVVFLLALFFLALGFRPQTEPTS